MIITTLQTTGMMSVDTTFTEDLNYLFVFNRSLPKRNFELPDDGLDFERSLVAGDFGLYEGYSIASISEGASKPLSAVGKITNGGVIYVSKRYTCIKYTNSYGFDVAVANGATYESNSIYGCLPTASCYTPAAMQVGVPCKSYAVINNTLFEVFEGVDQLMAFPKFDRGVIRNGRLVGAFGISSGTWGIDVPPQTPVAMRKSLLNKWRSKPAAKTLPTTEGVWLMDNNAGELVDALKKGASIASFKNTCGVYLSPVSGTESTPGVLYFGIKPEPAFIEKHWDTIGFCGAEYTGGTIDAVLAQICKSTTEDELKEAFACATVCLVKEGELAKLLARYEARILELTQKGLDSAAIEVAKACRDIVTAIEKFKAEHLNVGGLSSNFVNSGPESAADLIAVTGLESVLKDISLVLETPKLFSGSTFASSEIMAKTVQDVFTKTGGYMTFQSVVKEGEMPKLEVTPLTDALSKDLKSKAVAKAEQIAKTLAKFQKHLWTCQAKKGQSEDMFGQFHFSYTWSSPGVIWHTHQTQAYRYLGQQVPCDSDSLSTFFSSGGWWIDNDGYLVRGGRTAMMQKNTGIRSVSVSTTPTGETKLTMVVDTYYVGALWRPVSTESNITEWAREAVELALEGAGGFKRGWSVKRLCSKPPVLLNGQTVTNLNPETSSDAIRMDGNDTYNRLCDFNLVGCHYGEGTMTQPWRGARGVEQRYERSMSAMPVISFTVVADLEGGSDALAVEFPRHEEFDTNLINLIGNGKDGPDKIQGTIYSHAEAIRSYAVLVAARELFVSLKELGIMRELQVVGLSDQSYISTESLMRLTNFSESTAGSLLTALESVLGTLGKMENGKFVANEKGLEGIASDAVDLHTQILEIKSKISGSPKKAWFLGVTGATFLRSDWDLAGWYVSL